MAGTVPDIRIRIIVDNTGATATVTETKAAVKDLAATATAATPALDSTSKALDGVATSAVTADAALASVVESGAAAAAATGAVGDSAAAASTRIKDMVAASKALQATQATQTAQVASAAEADAAHAATASGFAGAGASGVAQQAQLQAAAAATRQAIADEESYQNILKGRITSLDQVGQAESELDRLVSAGVINTQQHSAALDVLSAAESKLGGTAKTAETGLKGAAEGAKALSGASSGVAREVGVLSGELARGNYTRLEGSLITLANRSGLLQKVLSPLGIGIGAVIASLGLFVFAAARAEAATEALNKAEAQTGNIAGLTSSNVKQLSDSLATSTVSASSISKAILEIASTGKAGTESLGSLTKAAVDLAQLTGTNAEKAAGEVTKLFDGTAAGALRANQQYKFLTQEQYEHIKSLQDLGDAEGAAKVEAEAFDESIRPRIASMTTEVTGLAAAWRNLAGFVKDVATTQWSTFEEQASLALGTADRAARIKDLQQRKAAQQPQANGRLTPTAVINNVLGEGFNNDDQAQLDKLQAEQTAAQNKAAQDAVNQKTKAAAVTAAAETDQIEKKYATPKEQEDTELKKIFNAYNTRLADAQRSGNTTLYTQLEAQQAEEIDRAKAFYAKKEPKAKKGPSDNSKDLAQEGIDGKISALQEAGAKLSDQVDNIVDPIQNKIDAKQDELNKALAAGQKQIGDDLREKRIDQQQAATDTQALTAAYTSASAAVTKYGEALRLTAAQEAAQKAAEQGQKVDSFLDKFQREAQPQNQQTQLADQLKAAEDEFDKLTEKMDKNSAAYQEYLTRFQQYSQELTDNTKKNGDQIGQFAIEAAKNIQDQLGKGLTDSLNGSFKDIPANFAKMLEQMMIQLISSEIGKYLFGDYDKTGQLGGVGGGLLTSISSFILGGPGKGTANGAPTALTAGADLLGTSPFNSVATGSPAANYGTLGAGNATGQQGVGASPIGGLLRSGASLLGFGNQTPAANDPNGAAGGDPAGSALTSAAGLLTSSANTLGLGSTTLGTNSTTLGTTTGLFSTATSLFGSTTTATLTSAATALTAAATALSAAAASLGASGGASGLSSLGGSGGGTSGFASLFSTAAESYDTGGYTGNGGKYQPAGIVHAGEFVMTAENTARYRPLLDAMHSGSLGKPHRAKSSYATGGLVQSIAGSAQPAGGQGGRQTIVNAITHDFVHQAMATAAGEKVTLNHITNNSRQVGQTVGVGR